MSKVIQSIRGMHDAAPEQATAMRWLETKMIQVLRGFAYKEVRTPIVEHLELFKRSIGEVTDIVEKEMYVFADRNGDQLALRPEGTASVVRAGVQHGWLHNQQQRLWYLGPFFRHERPQKGRYRQFHQLGVETFGMQGAQIEAELIIMSAQMWETIGLPLESLELQINSLGDAASRANHRADLIAYLEKFEDQLDEDAKRRLQTNPLRILDSKNPQVQEVVADAPKLSGYLSEEEQAQFDLLQQLLADSGIRFTVNPQLVRGLDYYNRTVFEWVSSALGAQGTICAGGRYDGLVAQLGGRATPAAGFAIGMERIHALVEGMDLPVENSPMAYMVLLGDSAERYGQRLVGQLRKRFPDVSLHMNCGGGSIKAQMKRADHSGANVALIIGDQEVEKEQVTVKYLLEQKAQITVSQNELIALIEKKFQS